MTNIETMTLELGGSNDLRSCFEIALAYRPDWALSFTAKPLSGKVRVTYSDNPRFGVSLQEAMNYIERHGGRSYDDDALLDARDMAEEIEGGRN